MSGVIMMTNTGGLLLSVFIASSMSGWSGCFYLTVWQTGVCLIYSVLTQGQGHTVRQALMLPMHQCGHMYQCWPCMNVIPCINVAHASMLSHVSMLPMYQCCQCIYAISCINVAHVSMLPIY